MAQTADTTMIREHMPVIDANGNQFATVDHLDANNTIKLTKDQQGQHHWIPASWVSRVDEHVHLDRPSNQVTQGWSTNPSG
jgi:hypothetical protein